MGSKQSVCDKACKHAPQTSQYVSQGDWCSVSLAPAHVIKAPLPATELCGGQTVEAAHALLRHEAAVLQALQVRARTNVFLRRHVVKFVCYDESLPALVLEYVPDVSFERYLDRRLPDLRERVLHVAQQIADILCALNTEFPGFRHGDLHLGNVLLVDDSTAACSTHAAPSSTHASRARASHFKNVRVVLVDFATAGQCASPTACLPVVDAVLHPPASDVLRVFENLLSWVGRSPAAAAAMDALCACVGTKTDDAVVQFVPEQFESFDDVHAAVTHVIETQRC